jgi:hypothetical protein
MGSSHDFNVASLSDSKGPGMNSAMVLVDYERGMGRGW